MQSLDEALGERGETVEQQMRRKKIEDHKKIVSSASKMSDEELRERNINFNGKGSQMPQGDLNEMSKEFMRDDDKAKQGVNLFNQNAPTINNAGDAKTVVPTSYINPNPTFNIINTSKVF